MLKSMGFTKIIVADLGAMEHFYVEGLGIEIVTRISVDEPGWELDEIMLSAGEGSQLILVHYRNRPAPTPGEAVIGLYVANIEGVVASAATHGATIVVPVREIPEHGIKMAYVSDPEGHMVEFLEQTLA